MRSRLTPRIAIVLGAVTVAFVATFASRGHATASQAVTIFADTRVVGPSEPAATVFGTISSRRAGEKVTIQAKDCGSTSFRAFTEAETRDGGGWSSVVNTGITATYRAVWKGASSAAITIRHQATVFLDRRRSQEGFRVGVSGLRSFWHKKVLVQRRQSGAWRTVKTVVLESGRSTGTMSWSEATFRLDVPRGTAIRAVLPLAQARPCYVAGTSRTVVA